VEEHICQPKLDEDNDPEEERKLPMWLMNSDINAILSVKAMVSEGRSTKEAGMQAQDNTSHANSAQPHNVPPDIVNLAGRQDEAMDTTIDLRGSPQQMAKDKTNLDPMGMNAAASIQIDDLTPEKTVTSESRAQAAAVSSQPSNPFARKRPLKLGANDMPVLQKRPCELLTRELPNRYAKSGKSNLGTSDTGSASTPATSRPTHWLSPAVSSATPAVGSQATRSKPSDSPVRNYQQKGELGSRWGSERVSEAPGRKLIEPEYHPKGGVAWKTAAEQALALKGMPLLEKLEDNKNPGKLNFFFKSTKTVDKKAEPEKVSHLAKWNPRPWEEQSVEDLEAPKPARNSLSLESAWGGSKSSTFARSCARSNT